MLRETSGLESKFFNQVAQLHLQKLLKCVVYKIFYGAAGENKGTLGSRVMLILSPESKQLFLGL